MGSFLSQNIKEKSVYPHKCEGMVYTADNTPVSTGGFNGEDTTSNDITVTMPAVSSFWDGSRIVVWYFKKMADANKVRFTLEDSNDSFMPEIEALSLSKKNAGLMVILNANGKYTFAQWDGLVSNTSSPVGVSTLTPTESGGTLNMNGSIDDLGVNDSVDAYFRYRDITTGGSWTETTETTVSAVGTFTDTATVTAGNIFEVQALAKVGTIVYYGAVLRTTVNYYPDLNEARNDGLVWGSRIQEGSGLTGADVFGDYDITFDGVTWGSDTINSQTINKVIFSSGNSGEAGFQPAFGERSYTILFQVQSDSSSGDHTILNFGRNILSLASDGADLQLEVGRYIDEAADYMPFSAIKNIWITVDIEANKTTVEVSTEEEVIELISMNRVPDSSGVYVRLAKGSSGDANHQDNEYMDDGAGRSIWIWEGVKPEQTKIDMSYVLDIDGGQIV